MSNTSKVSTEYLLEYSPTMILAFGAIINLLQISNKKPRVKATHKIILFCSLILALLYNFFPNYLGLIQGVYLEQIIQSLLITSVLILCLLAKGSYLESHIFKPEIAGLLQLSLIGMICFTINDNLCAATLGLEVLLIALYCLSAHIKANRFSQEGALKYFILGSLASSIFIFGAAMLYASTGKLALSTMIDALSRNSHLLLWTKIGVIGIIVGLAFKLSLFPFNLWTPDCFEGSPTMISAFMTISFKILVMGLIIKIFVFATPLEGPWMKTIIIISGFSVFFGTILALVQISVKRILAYIAISHSGYLTMMITNFTVHTQEASISIIIYLISYTSTSLLAFGILMSLEDRTRQNICLDDLRGLSKTKPWYALGLTIAIFSYAGLPPTAGFISKFILFSSAFREQQIGFLLTAFICNTISLVFYLRIISYMFMHDGQSNEGFKPRRSITRNIVLVTISSTTILLGTILPGRIFELITPVIKSKLSIP